MNNEIQFYILWMNSDWQIDVVLTTVIARPIAYNMNPSAF